jgi:hypothetical protein
LRKVTGKARIERMQRVSQMLNLRMQGKTLQEIADAQEPKITFQAVSKAIKTTLKDIMIESVAEVRALEAGRLDAMQNALWPQALAGDMQAINTVLSIMQRRARLLGLDLQRGVYAGHDGAEADSVDPHTLKVEIINDPNIERVRWLEDERERLLALVGETPTISALN